MQQKSVIDYYSQHSRVTELSKFRDLVKDLPSEIPELVKVVQGLLLHIGWARYYDCQLDSQRSQELQLRTVPEMLSKITELDSNPLSQTRTPKMRLVSICRDFSVLLVAFLREQGFAARLRVGFAGYFGDKNPEFWDHRLVEYWDESKQRWTTIDVQIDDIQMATLSHKIDPLDIGSTSPFLLAGEVWQRYRLGELEPTRFGDAPNDKGMAPIRYALLHDIDALNKVELLGFDAWHPLIDKPDPEISKEDYYFLDKVAELSISVDKNLGELQTLYVKSEYGQLVSNKIHTVA